ncbi:hypothetical protein [Paenibacillus sp. FSL R10-2736]|uniref:hypothetical protein n=1 Tax=Paenibacillus sp. FSL R10-2736 TaxID=2954692 RepID=UPI0030FB2CED
MKSSALILLFIPSFWQHLAELVGFIPLIFVHSPLSAELVGFIPLISAYSPLSAELVGFFPLIFVHSPLSAELVGFIPLIFVHSPLSAELEGFIPLISAYCPLSAELVGFFPLIFAYSPLSAELEGFFPLIFVHSPLSADAVGPLIQGQVLPSAETDLLQFSKKSIQGIMHVISTTDEYHNFLHNQKGEQPFCAPHLRRYFRFRFFRLPPPFVPPWLECLPL